MTSPRECSAQGLISREHSALVRKLASLQQRMDVLQRDHAGHIAEVEADRLRLRAELVLMHTAVLWGVGRLGFKRGAILTRQQSNHFLAEAQEAHAAICQVGCVGHGHVWLDAVGQCRRTGQSCERLPHIPQTHGNDHQ
jgi:hypothetical protein